MNLLALDLQRFPARRQDMDLRSRLEDALRQRSNRLDQMLAAVEHQQHAPVAQESGKRSSWIIEIDRQTHCRRDPVGNERRTTQWPEVNVMGCAVEGGEHAMADRDGNSGFSDPARTDDG